MAVTSKANATAIFDLKSAALTVLALLLKTDDLGVLAEALDQRFGATPGLFEHEPLCIDLSLLREAEAELDLAALVRLLQGHGFNPVAARGGSPAQMAAALAAGLAEAPEAQSPRPPAAGAAQPASDAPQAVDPAQAFGAGPRLRRPRQKRPGQTPCRPICSRPLKPRPRLKPGSSRRVKPRRALSRPLRPHCRLRPACRP